MKLKETLTQSIGNLKGKESKFILDEFAWKTKPRLTRYFLSGFNKLDLARKQSGVQWGVNPRVIKIGRKINLKNKWCQKGGPLLALFFLLVISPAIGEQFGSVGGAILLRAPTGRAAALGETLTAASGDIAAFAYNPASLAGLSSSEASFHFQEGLINDKYGQIVFGHPLKHWAFATSLSYYNSGSIDAFEEGTLQSVVAEKDLSAQMGFAVKGRMLSFGASVKFVRMEIAETEKAQGEALDFGVQYQFYDRLGFGGAVRNLGPSLSLYENSYPLPTRVSFGVQTRLPLGGIEAPLYVDAVYGLHEQKLRPGIGVEIPFEPLSLRAGYRAASDWGGFSLGVGFLLGAMSIDYALGLSQDLERSHHISMQMKFGKRGAELVKAGPSQPIIGQPTAAPDRLVTVGEGKRNVDPGDSVEEISVDKRLQIKDAKNADFK